MQRLSSIFLIIISSVLQPDAEARPVQLTQRWSYVVSYQGLFSGGMPVNMAAAHLEVGAAEVGAEGALLQAAIEVSTRGYDAAELFYPVRFCYRSRLDSRGWATLQADWLSLAGARVTRGRLSFDRANRQVVRLRARRDLGSGSSVTDVIEEPAENAMGSKSAVETKREQQPFPAGDLPLDTLSMLVWLREQPLHHGTVLEPAVRNGDQLLGYRIEVEGVEDVAWNGGMRSSFRMRLEPRVNDDSDVRPVWLWLSRDAARAPLRFRSSRAFGDIEARLLPKPGAGVSPCEVPAAADLVLPAL